MTLAADTVALLSNVGSSVFIIFVNKRLMGNGGYAFKYATTLCALHYLACTVSMRMIQPSARKLPAKTLPVTDLAIFTAVADMSIITLNMSLMLNPVGFYQIAKLLVIPFIALVERFWLGRRLSLAALVSIAIVATGVGIVTVTDVTMGHSLFGVFIAGMSVVCSGMQQILCRVMQQKHNISSTDFLAKAAPAQGLSLLLAGPLLDRLVSGSWVMPYTWTPRALVMLALSCSAAVGVNVSQFLCLGRFSAMTFQVVGHLKTVSVLLVGWAFLGDTISPKQTLGMAVAVLGIICYGAATSQVDPPKPPKKEE